MPNNRSFPPGWNRVEPPIGEVVEGTRFIAFKVPIERRVEWNLRTVKRNRPEIKCIIDMTNTFKYYSSNDCERADMHHFKIFGVPGQGAVPPEDKVILHLPKRKIYLGCRCRNCTKSTITLLLNPLYFSLV